MSAQAEGAAADDGVYRTRLEVRSCDADVRQLMRPSRLIETFQEAAIAHTELLGCGRKRTLDRGILWMVAERSLRVNRWPRYGERIAVESWPGAMRHVLFPRFERVLDERGRTLVSGSSIWMLVDARARQVAFPAACGVSIDGVERVDVEASPQVERVAARRTDHTRLIAASYALCDLNGHVNNARFVDVVEDALAGPAMGRDIAALACEYEAEVRFGQTFELAWCEDERGAYAAGDVDGKRAFSMELAYR